MIKENSGKIYRFQLDHNLGYGFAEIYDFTDIHDFDGVVCYVYNRLDKEISPEYNLIDITKSGISLGPIRLNRIPPTRGKYASKLIGQKSDFLINKEPVSKQLQSLIIKHQNWNNFNEWYRSDYTDIDSRFTEYKNVRRLETTILNHIAMVSTKFTMKFLIDNKENIADYYDLSEIGNLNMYIQLINTYYPLGKTEELLAELKKN